MLPLSLLLLIFLFIRACVPAPIADLKLVDVRRVSAAVLPADAGLRQQFMVEGVALWKVTVEGDANWVGEVRRHELNDYANVQRCAQPDMGVFALGPYVGQVLISYHAPGLEALNPAGHATLLYDIYLPETGHYLSQADFNAPMPSYNLIARDELCLTIAGGSMTGAYGRSNMVRFTVGGPR